MNKFQLTMAVAGLMAVLGLARLAEAQVQESWVRSYEEGGDNDGVAGLALDAAGCVYVTGRSGPDGYHHDYVTVKYDASGGQLWVARYDGPGGAFDEPSALAVDAAGNVYVTGSSPGIGSPWVRVDYATVKYDTNGNELWVRRYNGPANNVDQANAIALDSAGNCYVTGGSDAAGFGHNTLDIATIKYDPNGNFLWVRRYNGPGSGSLSRDTGVAIEVDASGNVYVTGTSDEASGSYDMVTLKYDTDGNQQWVQREGTAGAADYSFDLALDSAGNVFVVGECHGSGVDACTLKYDTNGNLQWSQLHPVANWALALAVDGAGNVSVMGGVASGGGLGGHLTTIRYDPNGTELWFNTFTDSSFLASAGRAIAVGDSGATYVTAVANRDGNLNFDILTIKYDSLGNSNWTAIYEGPAGDWDEPSALALDATENVYVAGFHSIGVPVQSAYVTIKYAQELGGEYCFGDGSATACPCGNPGRPGGGCVNSSGAGASLDALGGSDVGEDNLAFASSGVPAVQSVLLFAGRNQVNGGAGNPLGDGLRCAGGSVVRLGVKTSNGAGSASWGPGLGTIGGWSAGDTRYFQAWYRDPAGPCGSSFNLSNGVEVTFTP